MNLNKITILTILILIGIFSLSKAQSNDLSTCFDIRFNAKLYGDKYSDKVLQYCDKIISESSRKIKEKDDKDIKKLIEKLDKPIEKLNDIRSD